MIYRVFVRSSWNSFATSNGTNGTIYLKSHLFRRDKYRVNDSNSRSYFRDSKIIEIFLNKTTYFLSSTVLQLEKRKIDSCLIPSSNDLKLIRKEEDKMYTFQRGNPFSKLYNTAYAHQTISKSISLETKAPVQKCYSTFSICLYYV